MEVRAGDGDAEEEAGRDEDQDRGEEGDPQVRQGLAQDQLAGLQGRHPQLLHRPALFFPHHGDGGRKHGGQHQDEADEAGNEEPCGFELRVVPDARLEIDRRQLHPAARRGQGLDVGGGDQCGGVTQGRGRRVGVDTVEDELERHGFS